MRAKSPNRTVSLAQLAPRTLTDGSARRELARREMERREFERGGSARRSYSRRRAATLIGVHVLAAAHIAHWAVAGRSVAPLELNEAMHTLELGVVTAGFVLMALITLSACVFGRFFCSWGCHILALQDLCGWLLAKARIRAKPVRSRLLLLVGPAAAGYMFLWPQVERWIESRPPPRVRVATDAEGWGSFVTDDFFRNLPGPGVALLTFAVCGFVMVYALGTRSFCRYACPYGALFGVADRVAPGRIKVDPEKCTACGRCTAACTSHVRVHEEIARYGSVVDPMCLKDLDCVAACPEGALSFGWTRPSMARSLRPGRRRLGYDFSLAEEALMGAVLVGSMLALRGLYGVVPFLLSLAAAGILAYVVVLGVRLATARDVRFNAFVLKRGGRVRRAGVVFAGVAVGAVLFVGHCGFVRFNEWSGRRELTRATEAARAGGGAEEVSAAAGRAVERLRTAERWGITTAADHAACVASALWGAGRALEAEDAWRAAIGRNPGDLLSAEYLANAMLARGRVDLAEPVLVELTTARERRVKDRARYAASRGFAWRALGGIARSRGDVARARECLEAAEREGRW